MAGPVVPLQVLQQRKTLFELFQILTHGAQVAPRRKATRARFEVPGKDGGQKKIHGVSEAQGPKNLKKGKEGWPG
jgi:hypothetical protein